MKPGLPLTCCATLLAATACSSPDSLSSSPATIATSAAESVSRASLMGADNANYGEVVVTPAEDGLRVKITAEGMTPGLHGVHIHETGKCEGPDFKSAGGHWNPASKSHGFKNPKGTHKGDFLNLKVDDSGSGSLEATIPGASMSDGDYALLDADGAAFVVHEGADDQMTDPSGESGARLACGVFSRS